jgi:hypothetical protein
MTAFRNFPQNLPLIGLPINGIQLYLALKKAWFTFKTICLWDIDNLISKNIERAEKEGAKGADLEDGPGCGFRGRSCMRIYFTFVLATLFSVLKKLNSTSERAEASEASWGERGENSPSHARRKFWRRLLALARDVQNSKGASLARSRSLAMFFASIFIENRDHNLCQKNKIRSFLALWPQQSSFFDWFDDRTDIESFLNVNPHDGFMICQLENPLFGTLCVKNGVLLRHI